MTPREKWRKTWRMIRIIRRESEKSFTDQMIYGTSFIKINDNGEPECVPFTDIFNPQQW